MVAKVMAAARSLGWYAVKIHGNAFQLAGLPDVLAIKGGKAAWIEVKVEGNAPSRIQEHRMQELATAGCPVTVAYSAADARTFLENIE